jgi:hypothetical protein
MITVDPDDFPAGTKLSTVVGEVTFASELGGTEQLPPDGDVFSFLDPINAGNQVFGWRNLNAPIHDKDSWRCKWVKFTAEFTDPVAYVSLDFLRNEPSTGLGTTPDEWGGMKAYDAAGNELAFVGVMLSPAKPVRTVAISRPVADIKSICASGFFECQTLDHDVMLDRLTFSHEVIPEPSSFAIFLVSAAAIAGYHRIRKRRRSIAG